MKGILRCAQDRLRSEGRESAAKIALFAAIVAGALLFGVTAQSASATQGTLRVDSGSALVGQEVSVGVHANVGEPGLGTWTVDITYDSSVVSATGCTGTSAYSVCSTTFGPETVLVTGAHTTGLVGDISLATFTFRCERAGTSQLSISTRVFADATPDSPQDIDETVQNGQITCVAGPNSLGVIRIGSATATLGEQVQLQLGAVDIPPPGLGSWTVDVKYDPSVVRIADCVSEPNGVCNPRFSADKVRATGASATARTGTFPIATLVFRCERAGNSALHLTQEVFSIAGLPGPHLADLADGTITCVAAPTAAVPTPIPVALPSTGSASADYPSLFWPILALAAFGAAALAVALAIRRRA